jgi:flagellar protein FliS
MNPFRPATARAAYGNIGVETSVATAGPHQLIVLLFDGAIEAVADALVRMERKDIPGKGLAIGKAIRVLGEGLLPALDMERGGQIALNLRGLYEYMMKRLLEANLRNRPEILSEILLLLNELRGTWLQIGARSAPAQVHPMPASRRDEATVRYGAA